MVPSVLGKQKLKKDGDVHLPKNADQTRAAKTLTASFSHWRPVIFGGRMVRPEGQEE